MLNYGNFWTFKQCTNISTNDVWTVLYATEFLTCIQRTKQPSHLFMCETAMLNLEVTADLQLSNLKVQLCRRVSVIFFSIWNLKILTSECKWKARKEFRSDQIDKLMASSSEAKTIMDGYHFKTTSIRFIAVQANFISKNCTSLQISQYRVIFCGHFQIAATTANCNILDAAWAFSRLHVFTRITLTWTFYNEKLRI